MSFAAILDLLGRPGYASVMADEQSKGKSGLSTRGAVLVTIGIVLILGVACFIAAVVAPVMQTRAAVKRYRDAWLNYAREKEARNELERLGEPETAIRRLSIYLRLPEWLAPERPTAARMVGDCGKPAVLMLLRLLEDEDHDVRHWAAMALGEIGDPRAVEPLSGLLLVDEDEGVRLEAARALVKLKDRRATEALVSALRDEKWVVRTWAAAALGEIGDLRAVEPLIAALDDNADLVRERAARALGKLKDTRAIGPLIAALKDKYWGTRGEAVIALGEIRDPRAVEFLVSAIRNGTARVVAGEALGKIGRPAVEPLLALLKDKDARVRETAVSALGRTGDARAVKPLMEILIDTNEEGGVRRAAPLALGRIGSPAVKPLIAELKNEDIYIRLAIIDVLRMIGDARAVGPLIPVLRDENWRVRRAAAWVLGTLGDVRAAEPLILLLKDEMRCVRESAARALGRIGDVRAIGPLRAILEERDEEVRKAAAEALEKIGGVE